MNQYITYIPATGICVHKINTKKLRQSFQKEEKVPIDISSAEFDEKKTMVRVIGINVRKHQYKVHIFKSETEKNPIAERILSVDPLSKTGKIEHVDYW